MKDKRLRKSIQHMSDQDLTFSKEDRMKVFEQLRKMEMKSVQKKSPFSFKKFAPMTVTLLAVCLCLFFFIPTLLQENVKNEVYVSQSNGINGTDSNETVAAIDKPITALLTIKDEYYTIPINLLLSYSREKNVMKVISIPRDTYVQIGKEKDGMPIYGKLTFAYGNERAESVKTTVSQLFDTSIDYYGVLDLATLSALIDSVNGIEYDLKEDIRVRAISQEAFDFEKGTHHLNGEEVATLLMDATEGRNLDEVDFVNLMSAVINKTTNELSPTQLKELNATIDGNISIEQLFETKDLPAIQFVSILDGKTDTQIDGRYFMTFEKDFLKSAVEELTTFN